MLMQKHYEVSFTEISCYYKCVRTLIDENGNNISYYLKTIKIMDDQIIKKR